MTPRYPNFPADYEYPHCNICNSPEWTHRQLIKNAKGGPCTLVECNACGLRFFSPRPKWSVLKPYLLEHPDLQQEAENYFAWGSFTPVENPDTQKANLRSYYLYMLGEVIETMGRVPRTMFEVGGSVGWFALAAKSAGVTETTGLDLNRYAAQICCERQGLSVAAGDFMDYTSHRTYDLTVALDYLEHTYHPAEDLDKLAKMTEPGGCVLLKTFLDEFDPNHEMLAPPTHAIHWTTPVLRAAIEAVGLTVRNWRIDYHGYMVVIVAQKGTAQ